MKKLLALVLCVMMFVSVMSTAAFADSKQPFPETTATGKWASLSSANKAISNTKKNIEYMYSGLAADNAVFSTIKSMDSVVTSLVEGLFEDLTDGYSYGVYVNGKKVGTHYITQSNLEDNAKELIRGYLGGEVADYMYKHLGSYTTIGTHIDRLDLDGTLYRLTAKGYDTYGSLLYTDSTGAIWAIDQNDKWYKYEGTNTLANLLAGIGDVASGWTFVDEEQPDGSYNWFKVGLDYKYDPVKYANAFATAVSSALSSEKGAANLESYMYGLMALKVSKSVSDSLDDLATDIAVWEDGTAILGQYGFKDFNWKGELSLDPYAFINPLNLPKAQMDLSAITADDGTGFTVYNIG